MNLEEENIRRIKSDFFKMRTTQDLLEIMNYVNKLIYGGKSRPFKIRQLSYYAIPNYVRKQNFKKYNSSIEVKGYKVFNVKKKSGGERTIHAPNYTLKKKQQVLSFILQCVFKPSNSAYGFVRDKSIVDNAREHVGNYYVYNIDIKDFFTSIDQARIWKCLQLQPFQLNSEYNNGDRIKIANIIANISCVELEVVRNNKEGNLVKVKKDVLPQGAPTSPILTNVVCKRLDHLLNGVAKRFGLKYSRYADDITFSSLHNVYQNDSPFILELNRVIKDQGFNINPIKTRLQVPGMKKEVTGLVINNKLNVNKRYIKKLRMWLYYWEQYGYEKACDIFIKDYKKDKGHILHYEEVSFKNVLYGKLNFLRMVKGVEDRTYVKLKNRFVNLANELSQKKKLEQRKKDEKRYFELKKILDNLPIRDSDDISNLFGDALLKGELSQLEKKMKITKKVELKKIPINISDLPKIHNPKRLVFLLEKFSKNESALKYTTHSWDAGRSIEKFKDISEFLGVAKEEYERFSIELNNLKKPLNALIYNFILNPNVDKSGWGSQNIEDRIRFGWSSPELNSACKEDIDLNPEDFILPSKYQLSKNGKILHKFKHIIEYFKNQIEIRDENSALLELILEKHDKYLAQEKFKVHDIESLEDKTFYTYVPFFSKALDYIFSSILKRKQHPNISYKVHRKENGYELEILQLESFNEFKSYEDEKLNIDGGDFGSIAYYLKNLCDWSIESKFKEGAYRINFLTSEKDKPAYEKIDSAKGFKYILTFYK